MAFLTEFAAHLPFLMTVSPLFGAVLVWLNARRGLIAARQAAVTNATLTLGLALWMGANFTQFEADRNGQPPVKMATRIPWCQVPLSAESPGKTTPSVRIHLAFGVDGLSCLPLIAIALVGWVSVLVADRCCMSWTERSYAELLLGQALALAIFSVQDFLLFLAVCEAWAWWAYFVIGRQGGTERRAAAHRILILSSLAHGAWGLAGIGCAVCQAWIQAEVQGGAGGVSLMYPEMVTRLARWVSGHEMALYAWSTFQPWVLLLWLIGLWCRWPVFPFHGWWRMMLHEGRGPLAALCGAAAPLHGGYVLFRFVVPLFPPEGAGWAEILASWASLGACYFGFLAISQTSLRALVSAAALFALHAAMIGGLSGSVDGSVAAWQTLVITSFAVAAGALLIGRWEMESLPEEFAVGAGRAFLAPRGFLLLAISAGLLSAGPVFALISGQAAIGILELRRQGGPNLSLMLGSILTSVAVLRRVWRVGFGNPTESAGDAERTIVISAVPTSDLRGRELLIGVLVAAALSMGLMPTSWQPLVRPTFEQLHDPFAGPSARSAGSQTPRLRSDSVVLRAQKPDGEPSALESGLFQDVSAPLVWMIFGLGLLIAPRLSGKVAWGSFAGVLGLLAGLAVEISAGTRPSNTSAWSAAMTWSLGISGIVLILTTGARSTAMTNSRLGGWLMRLSAIGWAALTQDLLLSGLAWELAELARRLGGAASDQAEPHMARERIRHLLSSACFWLGVACCLLVTGTSEWDQIAAQLARTVPRDDDGAVIGNGPPLGLAAMVLLVSAIGIRCGLAPWSLGGRSDGRSQDIGTRLLDPWFGNMLGLTLLLRLMLSVQSAYGNLLAVMLAVAAAATLLWSALSTMGETRVMPLLGRLIALQFGGMALLIAATGSRITFPESRLGELGSQELLLQGLAGQCLAISVALCGLVAVLRRLGAPPHGDLFFEHYQGLFSKRRLEACLLMGSLFSLIGAWPFGGFWTRWLGCLGVIMTPQRLSDDLVRPHAVLLAGVVIVSGAMIFPLNAAARWLRHIAFDPAVSSWDGSGRMRDLAVAIAAVVLGLAAGLSPALFSTAQLWGR